GDLEGHLRGVHFVVAAVHQGDPHVHHRVAGQHTRLHGFLHAGLHRGDVLLGHDAAHDLALELEAATGLQRLDLQHHVAVLAPATPLPDELAFPPYRLAQRLPVSHLGPAHVGLYLELPQEPVHDDLQVQFAHALDDGLARFRVGV